MNFKRLRPRVNYPIMKKGGRHMISRKKPRQDGKKESDNQLQEVFDEPKKERQDSTT
jgi:hypothetical protein